MCEKEARYYAKENLNRKTSLKFPCVSFEILRRPSLYQVKRSEISYEALLTSKMSEFRGAGSYSDGEANKVKRSSEYDFKNNERSRSSTYNERIRN